ncbi:hypothetical protein GQ55_3G081900 [Panicum hallii var. hallii]|uniref:Uncharacterized protein n=1 Tax=Panicum hallii var. hallii TaxID=1504633 RepID=A0A2T7E703_9POAL|nr:hypothetical protein GQ55_3G081900 [Panicum hallii var. hallii]
MWRQKVDSKFPSCSPFSPLVRPPCPHPLPPPHPSSIGPSLRRRQQPRRLPPPPPPPPRAAAPRGRAIPPQSRPQSPAPRHSMRRAALN